MDFLNKAYRQLLDTLRPMSTTAKVTTALLLLTIGVSVFYLFRFQADGDGEYLLEGHQFTYEELNAALTAFGEEKLNDYKVVGRQIRVPNSKRAAFHAALATRNAMPESGRAVWDKLFDSSPLEPRDKRRQREKYRQKRDLEMTLSKIRGIRQASVEYNVEFAQGMFGKRVKSALVAVTPAGTRPLKPDEIKHVQNASAAHLAMEPSDVSVMDTVSGRTFRGSGLMGEMGDEYGEYKRYREADVQQKIYDQLSYIPGIVVNVAMDVDWAQKHEETTFSFPGKPTPIESSAVSEDVSSSRPTSAGAPGAQANTGNFANSPASTGGAKSTESTRAFTQERQKNALGHQTVSKKFGPYRVQEVKVSVVIPESYYANVWLKRNPVESGQPAVKPTAAQLQAIQDQEKQKIEELVNNLLPSVDAGEDPFPRVVVQTVTDLPEDALPTPTLVDNVTDWFSDNWSSLAMSMMGLVGLVFLRGMVKSAQANAEAGESSQLLLSQESQSASASGNEAEEDLDEEDEDSLAARRSRFKTNGPNLRDELTVMVKEDPDAAASVLAGWIGDPL